MNRKTIESVVEKIFPDVYMSGDPNGLHVWLPESLIRIERIWGSDDCWVLVWAAPWRQNKTNDSLFKKEISGEDELEQTLQEAYRFLVDGTRSFFVKVLTDLEKATSHE